MQACRPPTVPLTRFAGLACWQSLCTGHLHPISKDWFALYGARQGWRFCSSLRRTNIHGLVGGIKLGVIVQINSLLHNSHGYVAIA